MKAHLILTQLSNIRWNLWSQVSPSTLSASGRESVFSQDGDTTAITPSTQLIDLYNEKWYKRSLFRSHVFYRLRCGR